MTILHGTAYDLLDVAMNFGGTWGVCWLMGWELSELVIFLISVGLNRMTRLAQGSAA
jgi:hypothetical protein